jgi:hypothetical protein
MVPVRSTGRVICCLARKPQGQPVDIPQHVDRRTVRDFRAWLIITFSLPYRDFRVILGKNLPI